MISWLFPKPRHDHDDEREELAQSSREAVQVVEEKRLHLEKVIEAMKQDRAHAPNRK